MRIHRLVSLCCAIFATATLVSGAALAKGGGSNSPPKNLRAFLLSPAERETHVFPRTPAFAWSPAAGALCYEFELATSRKFGENSVVWSNVRYGVKPGGGCKAVNTAPPAAATPAPSTGTGQSTGASATTTGAAGTGSTGTPPSGASTQAPDPNVTTVIQPLKVPAVSVDMALPWFTGQPYAVYAHVRAITAKGPSAWSAPFAFNMRWPSVPTPLGAQPGLVRWTGVSGATAYQVWFPDIDKVVTAHTNVADLREFYTLHDWFATVRWRVRAVRRVFGSVPNGLPVVSYGPWSPTYTASNPPRTTGALKTTLAVSDRVSDGSKQSAHELMPGLAFSGQAGLNGLPAALYRAYAATDRDCVNIVYKGSIVGSPAYAPRASGPLKLSDSKWADAQLTAAFPHAIPDGAPSAKEWTTDWRPIVSNEVSLAQTGGAGGGAGGSASTDGSGSTGASAGSSSTPSADESAGLIGTRVDLPDIDFPTTRYYWTVVPVVWAVNASDGTKAGWWDAETPQDACAAGRVESFGKESDPVVTGTSGKPFVSGLTPNGRLLASAGRSPKVFSTPLIAWQPALGATAYEVQWSRTRYPWRAQGSRRTYSTSAVLDLNPGQWYYRVRGVNETQLKKQEMSWSAPVHLVVAKPKYRVASGAK